MRSNTLNLEGRRFNKLVAVARAPRRDGITWWKCICDCGNECVVRTSALVHKSQSCGCIRPTKGTPHGLSKIHRRTYDAWASMLARCENPKRGCFKNYGGRGISVCERWHVYANFLSDMGFVPDKRSLERIDNDGNYEPSNCRWATSSEQLRNRRISLKTEFNGRLVCLAEIAEQSGIPYYSIHYRYHKGVRGPLLTAPLSRTYPNRRTA